MYKVHSPEQAFFDLQLKKEGVMSGNEDIVKATREKLNMPVDAKPKYDKSLPLEGQMGMVPLTKPELPNQPEPTPKPHTAVKPIKVY
jgi:hypothetical protein